MTTTNSFQAIIDKLCHASQREYQNPYTTIEWPVGFDKSEWFMSPELLSLYGTETYAKLSDEQRTQLSFYEAVNFFSLNINGEKALTAGLAQRLYKKGNAAINAYLHHFLDEENKHMIYFGGFCMRYAKKTYPDKKMVLPHTYAPGEEDFLFFAKVMIFEELVDAHNLFMAKDERLAPVVRTINRLHHRDETRHLVFGRQLVKELFVTHSPGWSDEVMRNVRSYLAAYLQATWKEYYNPEVYNDAGLAMPYKLQQQAFHSDHAMDHRRRIAQNCVRFLLENNMLTEAPRA